MTLVYAFLAVILLVPLAVGECFEPGRAACIAAKREEMRVYFGSTIILLVGAWIVHSRMRWGGVLTLSFVWPLPLFAVMAMIAIRN